MVDIYIKLAEMETKREVPILFCDREFIWRLVSISGLQRDWNYLF